MADWRQGSEHISEETLLPFSEQYEAGYAAR